MTFKHRQIMSLFDNPQQAMCDGLWMSGIHGEGLYKEWSENGVLIKHYFWKNGDLNGEYKEWYTNGQLYIHSYFKNGDYNGEYKQWNDKGKLVDSRNYKDGVEI